MTAGPLTCRVMPPSGSPITLATNLQDINGQFSYVVTVPFETDIGVGLSSNALAMPTASASYTIDFFLANAPIRTASTRIFSFSRADRARQQRVDADFLVAFPDTNGNGLPDWWQLIYFGHLGNDPNADADGDGLSNLAEYLAGTNPTNRLSALAFVGARKDAATMVVEWSSVSNRTYSLLRSTNVLAGFAVLRTNLVATPPQNTFQDTTASGGATYFYRVKLE